MGCLFLGLVVQAKAERPALETAPARVTLRLGQGKQLQARLKGKHGEVRWSVEGEGLGSVSPTGFYQAPSYGRTPATVHVTASVEGAPELRAETLVFLEAVSVSVRPEAVTLSTGETFQLHAEAAGAGDPRVTWSVDGGAENGEVSGSGLYAAPARFLTPGTVTVRATSAADPSKSATAMVHIGAVGIEASPKEVTLPHGQTHRFTARVTGTANTAVEWKVLGEEQGEVTSTGLYTPPPAMATPAIVTLVASSAADPTKTATVRVQIPAIAITNSRVAKPRKPNRVSQTAQHLLRQTVRRVTALYLPFNPLDLIVPGPFFRGKSGKQYVPLGGGITLDAAVTNTTNDRLTWALEGQKLGEISEDGFYQAPDSLTTPQVIQVRATSVADPSKSLLFTLHVPPVVVRSEKEAFSCPLDGALQLKAKAENTEDDRLLWSVEGGDAFGTVTEAGLYHPPARLTTPASVRVRATSAADPSKSIIVRINVPEVGLEVSPEKAEVQPGHSVRLKARVKGCTGGAVTWKLTPEAGSVTPDGLYQAPETGGPQVVQVTATLKADPTKSAVATIRVRGG